MKIPVFKPLLVLGFAALLSSCGSTVPAITATPIENIDRMPLKVSELTETEMKSWPSADLVKDTIPGMSVDRAYSELLKGRKGKSIIVAVVDSGVDIDHEDLNSVIWINEGEKPGNGKDDDHNGYVDDIHGWNFLGDAIGMNLNYVRIYLDLKPKFESTPVGSVKEEDKEDFDLYMRAKNEYEKEYNETLSIKNQYEGILQQLKMAHKAVSKKLGKEEYTEEDLAKMDAKTTDMQQYKAYLMRIMDNIGSNIPDAVAKLDEALEYYSGRLDTHFNLELNGRDIVGDDPNDINDTDYGNNDVSGPDPKDHIKHGTHVAGIIAAKRDNGIGMNGVANDVKIMVIRAVPDGDEYDKDIALAIRYAVDNGAKIINTSFGKYFSSHPEWVMDAIKYAAKHDVLIVNAAGNEAENLDKKMVYPNDQTPENPKEFANNVLTVGALNYTYGSEMVAGFSNFGKKNVDVFAPGVKIWSTVPDNKYEFLQGTSMAAPEVAGVAAVIRSQYPKLSASQVKHLIMDSGLSSNASVIVGGDPKNVKKFSELSTSGKMINLYNALILADKISRK